MKDVKVISYIIPGKGRSENFKGTGGGTTVINNTITTSGGDSTPTGSVQYAEEAGTAKFADEAGKADVADRAKAADIAGEAAHADTATKAETAALAERAKHADVASNAVRADTADTAKLANEAIHTQQADRATEADHAKTAELSERAKNLTADSTDWQKIDGKIAESEKRAESKFLSKVKDDIAKGKITFEDFITLVRGMWLGDAKIVRAIQSGGEVEADDTAIMTVAKMIGTFLRKDTEDETRYLLKLLGGAIFAYLKTPDWTAGGMFGTGIGAYKDSSGQWVIETDKLLVRVKAIFEELEIRRLSYVGGNLLLSGAGSVIIAVEEMSDCWRCSIKSDDGSTATMNYWRAGDQIRCQTFNIKAGVYQNVQNRYYWRLVTEVGEDYIDVSKSDCESNSDAPAAGDHVVQLGNRTDVERQHAIMLSAVGSDAPAIVQYSGINSYRLTGKQKTRISPHGNIFTGDFYLNDGRSLLSVIDGKLTSVISETVRTATDKDNYLTNGSFATDLHGWQASPSTRYFKVGSKYVWANKSPLSNKLGAGCSWTTDSGHPVARIAASQLVQLASDYAKTPEIKIVEEKKQAVPVYLSMYVKTVEAGTLSISIANETTTDFETFTPLSYSQALTVDGEYIHIEATGYWTGTGNLTIATDGVMLIHDVMLTLNEYTYYESRIEQTAQHILLQVQRVEQKADSNTTRVAALEVTAESVTARVSAVETTASGNSTAIGALQVRATAIEASVTEVTEDVDGLTTRVGTLETTAESITARVSAVETTASGNSSSISTLQQTVNGISATVSSHSSTIGTMGHDIDSMTDRVAALELTDQSFQTSISNLQTTTSTHTGQISTLQQTAGSISTRVIAIENDYATGTELTQTSNSISARINKVLDNQGGRNLLPSSLINETSTAYGFAWRSIRLVAGQQYTLSVNGIVPLAAWQNNMVLKTWIYRRGTQEDYDAGMTEYVGGWADSHEVHVGYNGGNALTSSVTFTPNKSAMYEIMSYLYYTTGTGSAGNRSNGVTVNWYKLELGDTPTGWLPGINDQLLWKNYITNPRAIDYTWQDEDACTDMVDRHADETFGDFVRITHNECANWQLCFTAGNGYEALVGKTVTFFIICRNPNGYEIQEGANRKRLCFGGGDENVSAVATDVAEFIDLGNGWRKYYATRQIITGLMANTSGVDTNTIGINCVQGTWDVWACGVVLGGVCPSVQDIMQQCGLLATGIDITNGVVKVTADNFIVQNEQGQQAMLIEDGYVNMAVLNVTQIVADGISAQTINANNAVFQNLRISGSSVFDGTVKMKLLYTPIKTVSASSYQIDPETEPFTAFVYNGISGRNFIYLPKASDYDGMEIKIFQKLTASINVTENYLRVMPKSSSGDTIYIQQNIAHVEQSSRYYANPAVIPTRDYSANYYGVTASIYLIPNCMYVFKSMLGAWYAIEGLFTGE